MKLEVVRHLSYQDRKTNPCQKVPLLYVYVLCIFLQLCFSVRTE